MEDAFYFWRGIFSEKTARTWYDSPLSALGTLPQVKHPTQNLPSQYTVEKSNFTGYFGYHPSETLSQLASLFEEADS